MLYNEAWFGDVQPSKEMYILPELALRTGLSTIPLHPLNTWVDGCVSVGRWVRVSGCINASSG
jgi:hypothetical protein